MNIFTPFALSVGAKRRSRRALVTFRLRSLAFATLNANGFIKSSCNHG